MRPIHSLLLLLAAALPAVAVAEVYQVDLIVFGQGGIDGEAPQPVQVADTDRAIDPSDASRLRNAGIQGVTDGPGHLIALWAGLARGRRYEQLAHLSWVQVNPPEVRGPALHVTAGGTIDTPSGQVHALDGSVALHGGFYLHVDTDLVWTTRAADGTLASWRIEENRRLRLNETHYIDGGRLGVITRVTRLTR
jgi:hypothetical protein